MYIDTTSKDTIRQSLCQIINIEDKQIDELLEKCYDTLQVNHPFLDMDEQYDFFKEYVKEQLFHEINEVMFIHLSRRLKEDHDDNGYHFVDVLTKDTALSQYLKKYGITFKFKQHLNMYIHGKEVNVENCPYLMKRFGYHHHDFSFSGYGFKDHIDKSDHYNIAIGGPEFFGYFYLYEIDDEMIVDDFIENSDLYQFEYRVPIKDVEFENYEDLNEQDKVYHMIIMALQRLYFDKYDPVFNDQENMVIKIKDYMVLSKRYLIDKIRE